MWPYKSYSENALFILKSSSLYFILFILLSKYIVMMTKEGSSKIVNFMTPGAGVLVIGRGHISHNENALFL